MINYIFKDKRCSEFYAVASHLLTAFGTKFTYTTLYNSLVTHAEHPSLLTLIDVLSEYGVKGKAIRKGNFNYSDFEVPFVCSVQEENWDYAAPTVVVQAEDEFVRYLNPKNNRLVTVKLTDFQKIDQHVIVLLDGSGKKQESNYDVNRKAEKSEKFMFKLALMIVGLSILVPAVFSFSYGSDLSSWISLSFLLFSVVGTVLCVLVLLHDVDVHNPVLRDVCGGSWNKINCSAILSSTGASFLGVKLSIWAYSYFFSLFIIQFLYVAQEQFIGLLAASSFLTTPFIFYSLYYQARIAKEWCALCLGILASLLGLIISSILYFASVKEIIANWYPMSISLIIWFAVFLSSFYAVSLIKHAKQGDVNKKRWRKVKYSPDIFQILLNQSTSIMHPVDNLGIILGNENAQQEIIKVCNPFCGPCAKAHVDLEQIIANNSNVRIRIIFTASGEKEDPKNAPVAHLLAIEEQFGHDKMLEALNDWYSSDLKEYKTFAEKYPLNGELHRQYEKIVAMRRWCNETGIHATPTIYINGFKLPAEYQIQELKHFF